MYRASQSFTIFMGDQVNDYLAQKRIALQNTIEHIKAEDFLELDETDLINDLVEKFKVDAPVIDFENITVSSYEKEILAEQFPQTFYVRPGKSYLKQVVVYHLPFTGNDELFRYTPSRFMLWAPEVYIEDQNVCLEFVNFGDIEEIKREAQRSIDTIKLFSEALLQDVGSYDAQLRGNVEQMVKARKQKILDGNNMLSALGRPINKDRFTFGLGRNPFKSEARAAASVDDGRKNIGEGGEVISMGFKEPAREANTTKSSQKLRVFLCHSSGDKPQVREIYKHLTAEGVEAWLDEENLLPGQDWELEISRCRVS